jgi:hypothetical protein
VQGIVTIVTSITPGHVDALHTILRQVARQLPPHAKKIDPGPVPFERLTTVHYLRWVVLPEALDAQGRTIDPELLLTCCFDGAVDAQLAALVDVAGAALVGIYGHCVGSPAATGRGGTALVDYLRAHVVPPAAYYVANRRRSAVRIRQEGALHRTLGRALDPLIEGPDEPDAETLVQALRGYVAQCPGLRWALEPPVRPPLGWYLRYWGRLALVLLAALLLLPVLVPVGLVVLGILRRAESREGTESRAPIYTNTPEALAHLDRLTALEDFEIQNEVTHVSPLRPGRFVRFTLRVVGFLLQLRSDYIDTKGSFGGIASIHFAHWNVIDDGRRLLFCSNYDGTWESYLDTFIDRAASALTAVWSRCIDFPHTHLLLIGGARDEERFKKWFRTFQVPSSVWYAAYPRLSVQNIQNNTAIREGLTGQLGPAARRAWLRRF